jgi:preprotein translocase subunit YajC
MNILGLIIGFTGFASYAMASGAPAAAGGLAGFNAFEMVKFLPFFFIFYYFLIHQPKKKAQEHQKTISALKKGDKVILSGGIIGVIHKIDDSSTEAAVEISDEVKVTVLKSTLTTYVKEVPVVALPTDKKTKAIKSKAS